MLLGGFVAAYQIWVSTLLLRSSIYEPRQRWFQMILIWLIPVVGAIVVHMMLKTEGMLPYQPEKAWTEPRDTTSDVNGGTGDIGNS